MATNSDPTIASVEETNEAKSELSESAYFILQNSNDNSEMNEYLLKAAYEEIIITVCVGYKIIYGIPLFNTPKEIKDMFVLRFSVTNGINTSAVGGSTLDIFIKNIAYVSSYKLDDGYFIDKTRYNTVVSKYVRERGGRIC
jgi:hypothetical protein